MQPSFSSFDPCSLFPARIKRCKFKAEPISARDRKTTVGGSTDLVKRKAYLPMANNAYARTVRLHEALHAIYTPKPTRERRESGKPPTMLEQALEDARLHLVCARTSGAVRRDELATALRDIRGATSSSSRASSEEEFSLGLMALLALRSAAILNSHDDTDARAKKRLDRLCEIVAPDYARVVMEALERIRRVELAAATRILQPYFAEEEEKESSEHFPFVPSDESATGSNDGDGDVSFAKISPKLTSDAVDLLDKEIADAIAESGEMPIMRIISLYAQDNVKTFVGETAKHVMAGSRIHARKLALTVSPIPPKIFLRTVRRNGGSVLIDASSSMSISMNKLFALLQAAPMATIAFYNAATDLHRVGNLWIFAHQGRRAYDLSAVKSIFDKDGNPLLKYRRALPSEIPDTHFGWGNVVDFQALQWLLAQPKPRYFLTDGHFTGPEISRAAATKLLENAMARKKVTQVTSFQEMVEILEKRGLQ
jgi:hypothetical protein